MKSLSEYCSKYNCYEIIEGEIFCREVEVDILDSEIYYDDETSCFFGVVNGVEYEIRERL